MVDIGLRWPPALGKQRFPMSVTRPGSVLPTPEIRQGGTPHKDMNLYAKVHAFLKRVFVGEEREKIAH